MQRAVDLGHVLLVAAGAHLAGHARHRVLPRTHSVGRHACACPELPDTCPVSEVRRGGGLDAPQFTQLVKF